MLRILFLGDTVGEPGRKAVIDSLAPLREELAIDFIIVNGENTAGGRGITPKICIDLLRAGAAVVTSGDHIWDQREIVEFLDTEPRLLRPGNYPPGTPGNSWIVLETAKGKVGVVSIQGRTFMLPILDNPFHAMDAILEEVRKETATIFVDMHAETTSEKIAMARYLDGRISALVGTHTHVQTADEQIFPGGTAFLCDAGMCGGHESILGRRIEPIVDRFLKGLPCAFPVAKGDIRLNGAIVDIDTSTGRAVHIERFSRAWTYSPGREATPGSAIGPADEAE